MDFLRPRAIPALIALALASSPAFAAEGCSAIDGTYAFEAEAGKSVEPMKFHLLMALPREAQQKIYRVEAAGAPKSLSPSGPMARPKVTYLATRFALAYRPEGTRVTFLDAAGKALVELPLDGSGKWSCKDGRLVRESERTTGTATEIRTERVEQSLRNDGKGLVLMEVVTQLEPKKAEPRRLMSRFAAAKP